MSNAYLLQNVNNLPPVVATSYITQNGTAIPSANILIIDGFSSTENNNYGIITKGGVIGTGTSNEVDVILTNRYRTNTTTSGAVTSTVTLLSSLSAGIYVLDVKFAGNSTSGAPAAGVGYTIVGAVRSDGVTATLISGQQKDSFEEPALVGANAVIGVSGNAITATLTGVAAYDISWVASGDYTFLT